MRRFVAQEGFVAKLLTILVLALYSFPMPAKLIYSDSFDHYTTLLNKWSDVSTQTTAPAINAAKGRNGTAGGYFLTRSNGDSWFQKNISSIQTIVVGVALYLEAACADANDDCKTIDFKDSGTTQVSVDLTNAGQVKIKRAGVLLATAGFSIPTATYVYLEAKVVIATGTGGSVVLRLNGGSLNGGSTSTHTSLNTSSTGNAFAGAVRIGSVSNGDSNASMRFDDVYIADTTGSFNNDFIGDVRIYAVFADGAGDSTQLALTGAATNWQAVSENPPDSDTSYVSSSTVTDKDLYNFATVPAASVIPAVVVWLRARKDDAGTRSVRGLAKLSGTEVDSGADAALNTTYTFHGELFERDPATNAWTGTNFNSSQFGVKVSQ